MGPVWFLLLLLLAGTIQWIVVLLAYIRTMNPKLVENRTVLWFFLAMSIASCTMVVVILSVASGPISSGWCKLHGVILILEIGTISGYLLASCSALWITVVKNRNVEFGSWPTKISFATPIVMLIVGVVVYFVGDFVQVGYFCFVGSPLLLMLFALYIPLCTLLLASSVMAVWTLVVLLKLEHNKISYYWEEFNEDTEKFDNEVFAKIHHRINSANQAAAPNAEVKMNTYTKQIVAFDTLRFRISIFCALASTTALIVSIISAVFRVGAIEVITPGTSGNASPGLFEYFFGISGFIAFMIIAPDPVLWRYDPRTQESDKNES